MTTSAIHIGILYPKEWFGDEILFEKAISEIEEIDEKVRVSVVPYVEDHAVRTLRSSGEPIPEQLAPPLLSAEQEDLFSVMEIAVAIDLPESVTTHAPNLRWIQAIGAGTGQLQDALKGAQGVTLTGNGGANGVAIAEFVMGRLIEWAKNFKTIATNSKIHAWEPIYGDQLAGKKLCLIGYGAINQAVAIRALAFEMDVVVVRRNAQEIPDGIEAVFSPNDLHSALQDADVVVAAVPETKETVDLMDKAAFAAMKPGAFFVNVGRGTLVTEPALIEALVSRHLSGAAIDVARHEPLATNDPLWEAPNLVLSAHCSAAPNAMFQNVHRLFIENLRRYLSGDELLYGVSFQRGY